MWSLRSIGYRTDLFLAAFDGFVEPRERYVVIRTPSNPDFWWGNYLLYPEPPDARSFAEWQEDFRRELPHARTTLLAWDRPDGARGDVAPFLADGFTLDEGTVLTAAASDLERPPASAEVVALSSDADWEAARVVLTNAFMPNRSGSEDDLRAFIAKQLLRYRAMQSRGIGQWYGARVDGDLAAALGVVRDAEVGRFQLVGTDPRFARRGACRALVYEAATRELARGLEVLAIAADATYHAARVYESVGFRPTERLYAVVKKPKRM